MYASSIGTLVLYLRDKAEDEGRLDRLPKLELAAELRMAEEIMAAIRAESTTKSKGAGIGSELRSGRTNTNEAKLIRFAAQRHLLNYGVLLDSIDKLGYTPQNLRAALVTHWEHLTAEPLGSDGNCIVIDIEQAVEDAPGDYREAIERLMAGQGPQLIGEELEVNGSRLVGKALKYLSSKLEGRPDGKRQRKRRWKVVTR